MRCLYCEKQIDKLTLSSIFIENDCLCHECRKKLKIDKAYIKLNNYYVETFYNYDGIFRDLLIQYKECYDEALACTFLYRLKDYIRYKYNGYEILFIPSSKNKLQQRGFNHLDLIFKEVGLKKNYGLKMKENLVQEGKNFSDRSIMIGNFEYFGGKLDKALIVDDVITSGSSILGAIEAIKPYANVVKVISLSRKENAFISRNKCVKIKKRRII